MSRYPAPSEVIAHGEKSRTAARVNNSSDGRRRSVKPCVAVILRHGLAPDTWRERHARGEVVDETPYAYHLAGEWFDLEWSADHSENRARRAVRTMVRRALGFDLIHVWRNRDVLRRADVVWTHTEREHLGVALLKRVRPRTYRAKTIAQSVWLWDEWTSFGRIRQGVYGRLLRQHDVEVVLSRVNRETSRSAIPGRRVLRLPFGTHPSRPRESDATLAAPASVLAVGNDRHRDWALLLESARSLPDLDFEVVSLSKEVRRMPWPPNVRVLSIAQADILQHTYQRASVVAIPLTENLHASGCTVAIEAISVGVPVVATNTGGIDEYLANASEFLIAPDDREAFARALRAAAGHRPAHSTLAYERGLTHVDYIRRLALLTQSLLSDADVDPAVEVFAPVPLPARAERETA